MHYTAEVEVARRADLTEDEVDAAMTALAEYAPALGVTPRGHQSARMTFPADSITQAATTAAFVAANALAGDVIRIEVMPEGEADLRIDEVPVPDLLSTVEAAELLGVSQQRVRQLIGEGKLASYRVGERAIALARGEVEAARDRRAA